MESHSWKGFLLALSEPNAKKYSYNAPFDMAIEFCNLRGISKR